MTNRRVVSPILGSDSDVFATRADAMACDLLLSAVAEIILDITCKKKRITLSELGSEIKVTLGYSPSEILNLCAYFEGGIPDENHPISLLRFIRRVPFLSVDLQHTVEISQAPLDEGAYQAWKRGTSSGALVCRRAILTEVCRRILQGHPTFNPNEKDRNENTLLHLIAGLPSNSPFYDSRNKQYLKLLLKNGSDPKSKNHDDVAALHVVVGRRKFDSASLAFCDPEVDRMRPEAWSCNSRLEQLKLLTNRDLLSSVQRFESYIKMRGPQGNNILHEWVLSLTTDIQNERQIGVLITSLGVQPGACNDVGCTPLHYACDAEVFNFLLSNGCNIERRNDDGDTAFLAVIRNGIITGNHREKLLGRTTTHGSHSAIEKIISTIRERGHDLVRNDEGKNAIDLLLGSLKQSTYKPNHFISVCDTLVSLVKCCGKEVTEEDTLQTVMDCIEMTNNAHSPVDLLVDVMDTLLEKGANPNARRTGNGLTLLRRCCGLTCNPYLQLHAIVKLITLLRFHGADLEGIDTKDIPLEKYDCIEVALRTQPKTTVNVDLKIETHEKILKELCVSGPRKVACYRYDPANPIGEGAMGKVFPAIDEKGKREVALKRIQKDHKEKMLKQEIETLCKMNKYEQVVNYYTVIDSELDFYFIVLELMEGDLADLVEHEKSLLKSRPDIIKLVGDMVEGLKHLHSHSILHRDLKPGNVLYSHIPILQLKIADFGLAKDPTAYSTIPTSSGHSLTGTRGWMAPELVTRTQTEHTKETDVFSLGLVSHFLMSGGKHPFDAKRAVLKKDAASAQHILPHELEQSIAAGAHYMDIQELTPAGHHLLTQLVAQEMGDRPEVVSINEHCFFWDDHKQVQFLMAVGDQEEFARSQLHSTDRVIRLLEATPLGRQQRHIPWDRVIPDLYTKMIATWSRKKYNTTSLAELVRFFRNAHAHEEEQSSATKAELKSNIFFQKFPSLLLTVWGTVRAVKWHQRQPNGERQRIHRALSMQNNSVSSSVHRSFSS